MTIVGVIASLGCGGAERVLTRLASHWVDRHRVTLLSLDETEAGSFFPVDERVRVVALDLAAPAAGWLSGLANNRKRLGVLRRALRASEPDVVVSFGDRTNVLTLLASRGLGVPVVISERCHPGLNPIGRPWGALRRLSYPWAQALVVQTARIATEFEGMARGRLVVIPNPVELPAAAEIVEPDRRVPVIAAMGRLVPQKGFDLLLHAFAKARRAGHDEWRLLIAGEGPDQAVLQALADSLGLGPSVTFAGRLDDPWSVLGQGEVFALPSRYEGFPNALAEAMARGLAVVAADCPTGPAELIEHGQSGLLVPSEDASALGAALLELMESPALRRRFGSRARERAARYAPAMVFAEWSELLRTVTRESGVNG